MRILFTPSARDQFLSGLAYIRKDNPSAAREFRRTAERILRRLEDFPQSGWRLPEYPELPHREVVVRPYRFFYRLQSETGWIVGVWHGAQLPQSPAE